MKKRIEKKCLVLGLLLMITGGICFFKTDTTYASVMTSAQLQEKFPNGKYWNHVGNPGSSNNKNNQDGYTSTPCSKHGTVGTSKQTCNGFAPDGKQLSWQCMGFAEKLGYDFTGSNPRENRNGWSTSTSSESLNSLKAGDIVRYKNNGHSIFVTAVNGNTVSYADCNSDGHCRIRWNSIISKSTLRSSFTYKRSAPYELPSGNMQPTTSNVVNPNPASNPDPVPSINSVTINGIDNGSISFSFSVSNGTLAKVVIESTLTGKTKVDSFTSNLSNITYIFNRMSMPTGGNQYHIYLYAYSGSVNNYKNEQVHKMTYGPAMQCVTFPDTISNDQMKILTFNARFYADMYEDVRKAFGYDEKMLYKHWLNEGIKEGRIGCPGYCGSFYLKNHGDIANAYGAKNYELAFYHYTTYGYKEERESSPVFSASYYLKNNGDIANAYGKKNLLQAAIHYNIYGINELRNSSVYYYGQYYKDKNGDLSKMTPYELLLHYYKYGIGERRYANSGNKVPNI